MAVFSGYKLEDLWELPFSALLTMSKMAEDQKAEQSAVFRRGYVASKSEEGSRALELVRDKILFTDPEKLKELKSKENLERIEKIRQKILNSKK